MFTIPLALGAMFFYIVSYIFGISLAIAIIVEIYDGLKTTFLLLTQRDNDKKISQQPGK